jgi:hypothetical protein
LDARNKVKNCIGIAKIEQLVIAKLYKKSKFEFCVYFAPFFIALSKSFFHFALWASFFTLCVRGPLAFLGRLLHGFQYFLLYTSLSTFGIHIIWKQQKKV